MCFSSLVCRLISFFHIKLKEISLLGLASSKNRLLFSALIGTIIAWLLQLAHLTLLSSSNMPDIAVFF